MTALPHCTGCTEPGGHHLHEFGTIEHPMTVTAVPAATYSTMTEVTWTVVPTEPGAVTHQQETPQ